MESFVEYYNLHYNELQENITAVLTVAADNKEASEQLPKATLA